MIQSTSSFVYSARIVIALIQRTIQIGIEGLEAWDWESPLIVDALVKILPKLGRVLDTAPVSFLFDSAHCNRKRPYKHLLEGLILHSENLD